MSINLIESIFENIENCENLSLQILKITNSKKNGTIYKGREIILKPDEKLSSFVKEISQIYLGKNNKSLNSYENCIEYDGTTNNKTIYKLNSDDELIKNEYEALLKAISNPDTEINPFELKCQAYLIQGVVHVNNQDKNIKLISMQNPITSLKNKFFSSKGTFKEITDKVISLKNTLDVIIIDKKIYMMTLSGENLFNMKRAYKGICLKKVKEIEKASIIENFDVFNKIATSGHNPRKFITFNNSHLDKLKDINQRKIIAKKFMISMVNEKFDGSKIETAEKLVKLLCQRGMLDPFDEEPMEVSGSRKWE